MNRLFSDRFQNYSLQNFRKDLLSGLIVGIIAIPLGMAFAIASGVEPEYGIYTTIIAGVLISLFGGSKYQIGGPTGAFIPILFSIVMVYGYENLLIAGFLAGIMLFLMGVFKLGSIIKFIPRPVTIGFTAGIAITIFTGQIANFLGLAKMEKHEDFLSNMWEIATHLHTLNVYSIIISFISLVMILLTPKFLPKVPGPLIGLAVSSLFAFFVFPDKIATIGSTFGEIPSGLPTIHIPQITWGKLVQLIQPAFIIAMLGGIESLLSAVVADKMSGTKHDSNRELLAQGIANMVTPLFGGIPATGAIARTATNIKNGATSPMSGIIHAFVVLLVLLVLSPYASVIPLASMAPVLMVVAWNMSERKEFIYIAKTKTNDALILSITFILTVFTNLTVAIEVGLLVAIVIFAKRMGDLLVVTKALPDPLDKGKLKGRMVNENHDCSQISIFTIDGPLFFGVARVFEELIMNEIKHHPRVLLLRMENVHYMDTTCESHLENIVHFIHKNDGTVIISDLQHQPEKVLKRTGLYEKIGENNFFAHTGDAVTYSLTKIQQHTCNGCHQFVFQECSVLCQQNESKLSKTILD